MPGQMVVSGWFALKTLTAKGSHRIVGAYSRAIASPWNGLGRGRPVSEHTLERLESILEQLEHRKFAFTAIAAGSESAGWEAFTTAAVGAEGYTQAQDLPSG